MSASCFPFWKKQQENIRSPRDLKSVGQIKARCQEWENKYKLSDNKKTQYKTPRKKRKNLTQ